MSDKPNEPEEAAGGVSGLVDEARARVAKIEEEARVRAAAAAAEAAVVAAGKAAARAADGVLDGLESLLFGKVGGAEEHLRQQEADPLTRLRSQYAAKDKEKPAPAPAAAPKNDPVAKARAELEALKAARRVEAPRPDDTPIKKTL